MQSTYDSLNKTWNGPKLPYQFPLDYTVGELVYQKLLENPEKVIQISEFDGVEMTCEDLRINSVRIAQNFSKIGIKEDDIVCTFLKQTHFATYFLNACVFTGVVIQPLDILLDPNDIKHVLNNVKPKIIISDPENAEEIQKLLEVEIPIFVLDRIAKFASALDLLNPTNDEDNFTIPKFQKPSNEKLLAILSSSGTTGRPKGVCTTHELFLSWAPFFKQAKEKVSLIFSPIYWGTGFYRNILTGIDQSNVYITTNRPINIQNFIDICEKYKVQEVTVQASYLATILNSEEFISSVPKNLQSFMAVGAVVSENLRRKFENSFPDKNLTIVYGMTEIFGVVSLPGEYKKDLSVGSVIYPNISIKIVDNDGNALENGQRGEVCMKNSIQFSGYYNNPQATKEALDSNGFYKTGDFGYFDKTGILYIIDRIKDIWKYKGYQVNPSDIENVIQNIEGVQQVSVVGIPDENCTTLLAAGIMKTAGIMGLTEKDVTDHVEKHLPFYKHLHGGVYFFKRLPMTPSRKIQRRLVLEAILKARNERLELSV